VFTFSRRTTSLRAGDRAATRSCLRRGGGRQAGAAVLSCLVWRRELAYGVTESWDITNMSCKSAILKKSSSNWLNSGKPLTQQLKGAIFAFPGFPGRAETVVK